MNDVVVYRVSAATVSIVSAILLGVGASLLFALSLIDSPPLVLVLAGAGWLLFCAFVLALLVRPATAVSGAGIEVRRVFGWRVHPWTEITDVRIEEVSGQSAARLQVFGAVVYDAHGRRVVLPYLNHRRLGSTRLEAEVREFLRRRESERGPKRKSGTNQDRNRSG